MWQKLESLGHPAQENELKRRGHPAQEDEDLEHELKRQRMRTEIAELRLRELAALSAVASSE